MALVTILYMGVMNERLVVMNGAGRFSGAAGGTFV